MPQRIEVPGMGIVEFPDGMTDDQITAAIKANMPKAEKASKPAASALAKMVYGGMSTINAAQQGVRDMVAGGVRGAGSIGATVMMPFDARNDRVDPQRGITSLVTGQLSKTRNEQRRAEMDAALQAMGANPTSFAYGGGKLAGEIAGTAGVGGGIANLVGRAAPALAARAAPALDALRTAGMSAGGVTGAPGLALRTGAGAVTGGASALAVNPEDAGMGAGIGAVLPGTLQGLGKVGRAVGGSMRGPQQTPEIAAAVQSARQAGYVIPPTQARPTLGNRIMEGFAGKLTTAQNASAKNQAVTNKLVAEALGLAPDAKITPDVLNSVRKAAGQAYDAIGQTGAVTPPASYTAALDAITAPFLKAAQGFPNAPPSPVIDLVESLRSPSFDAAAAVAKVKQLRTQADDAFRKGDTDIARAAKAASKALEDALDGHVQTLGNPALLQEFRDARQLIAKTYTVQKALNPASGSVDARKLAGELKKGKPLSGGLKDAASFGLQFPKASQAIEGMGSLPQTSPLDWAALGSMSAVTGNPLMMLGTLARPAARAAVLSGPVQNRLLQQPAGNALNALQSPELQQFILRGAPVAQPWASR